MVPRPPSHDSMVDCQPLSSQPMPSINGSRTVIEGGLLSDRLSVGRYERAAAALIAAATSERGETGPVRCGQVAPLGGALGPGGLPPGGGGGGLTTVTGLGGGGAFFFVGFGAAVRVGDGDGGSVASGVGVGGGVGEGD